jgi:3-oxosteroid 1-dehydrogenase
MGSEAPVETRWDQQADIVVVGSGSSGCAAALAASEHGFDTILLEKGASAGGGTAYSSGGIWIPGSHLAREAGIADSREEALQYLRFLGAGYQIEENVAAYLDYGPEALAYFAGLGIKFQLVRNVPDIYSGMAPGAKSEGRMIEIALFSGLELGAWQDKVLVSPFTLTRATFDEAVRWGGRGSYQGWDPKLQEERRQQDARALGAGLVAAFVKALIDRKIPILLNAPARRLILEGDRVVGVAASIGGIERNIAVRHAVILATGGYEGNPDLIANYEDIRDLRNMFPDTITGDGLTMGAEVGAMVRVIPRMLTIFLGYDVPARGGRPAMFRNAGTSEIPQPHSMVVNRAGRRFGDEAFFQKLQNGLRHFDVPTHTYSNQPCFWILDSQYVRKYSLSGLPIGEVPDFVARGDSPAELARALGIDGTGLADEMKRFNGFVAKGKDEDFGRGSEYWSRNYSGDLTNANPNLGTIEVPPFYGIRLQPSGMSSAGLLANPYGQVMSQRNTPIGGLYALANCAAGVEFGVGYQAGLSLGKGMIFGYRAVKQLAAARDARARP